MHESDFSEQGVNPFRRVHNIPPEILIAILAESTFGDIVRDARVSDVGESERLAHRQDILENIKEIDREILMLAGSHSWLARKCSKCDS